jgi:transposase
MHRANRSHEGFRRAAVQAVLLEISPGGSSMTPTSATLQAAAPNYDTTLVLAIELSNASWVLAAQVPGLPRVKARRSVEPTVEALMAAIRTYRDRARQAGHTVERVIAIYEASWSGFWLARWLRQRNIDVHVVQPSSIPVDRRARRAKSDGIDAELLLRSLLAWLRGEPRVCSMVPVPAEADEDARRCIRERAELVSERVSLVNRISAVLATLGVSDFNPLLRNRRQRLEELRTGLGTTLPRHARAKIIRMIDRLELVQKQICELDRERDAVLEETAPDKAGLMIQELVKLRGIGVQSATVLVHEAFVREFANGKALGSYAGLTATPYSSGSTEREQGIDKAGNRRLRTVMVELAWLWQRYQPGSAQVKWFRARVGGTGTRMRKVMVVALARKLLIALWRFATQGVLPEGATMKPAP